MEKETTRVAIVGNPNSGKTTVFNQLTGARQKVGNWPGVTVEKKEGYFEYKGKFIVIDLPGCYSLTAYSLDERIARNFIVEEKPEVVVAIIDASNLERNLYLAVQLLELGANLVLDLNMMDLAKKRGLMINTQRLSDLLGVPVVETVANRGEGIEQLKETIYQASKNFKSPYFKVNYSREIEEALSRLSKEFSDFPGASRWFLVRLLEGDEEYMTRLRGELQGKNLEEKLNLAVAQLEQKLNQDLESYLIESRYGLIHGLVQEAVEKRRKTEERLELSDRIDRVVINKYLGIPIFLFLLWLTFQLTFKLGDILADPIDQGFGWLGEKVSAGIIGLNGPGWLASLLSEGIIAGVGSVLVFLPYIMLLFLAIAIMEDSGYLARAAFVMDRVMHSLGLHGKSAIPMLLGFGCNIPAIMACRTLESRKDRVLTILINPLMSCSARLPIYVLFAGAFFARHQPEVIFSLYLLGIILAIAMARLFKSIFFREEVAPLIMELPPYRFPYPKSVLIHMWERSWIFIRKAGTIIFGVVVLVWLLSSLPPGVEYGSEQSLIGALGKIIAPILKPAGFGFWQAGVALIFGILAKEVVVGTFGTLFGAEDEGLRAILVNYFNPASAYAFMVMCLIYIPCVAAIATIKKELGWRWAIFATGYSLLLGWVVAVIFYQVGKFLI